MGNYQWKNHQSSIYFLIYLFNLLFFIFRIGFNAVHGGKYYLVSEIKFSRYKQKVNKLVGEIIIDNFFRNLYSSNCSGLVGKIRKKVDDLFFFTYLQFQKMYFLRFWNTALRINISSRQSCLYDRKTEGHEKRDIGTELPRIYGRPNVLSSHILEVEDMNGDVWRSDGHY